MNPRRRLFVIFLLSATLILLVWLALGPPEPTYLGKPFSVWVLDLDDPHPGPKNDQAEDAIRHIGDKAMPQIIGMLNTRGGSVPDRIIKWAIAHHFTKRTYTDPEIKHHRAVLCCYVIGPKAKPAIPALISLLNLGYTHGYVGAALSRIGPDSVAPLIRELTSTNLLSRVEATHTLADFPGQATIIVPELIRCLKDPSPYVRSISENSLSQLAADPAIVIPALVTNLTDADIQVRWCACLAIGKFKSDAGSAVPSLRTSFDDAAPEVRATAAIALAEIKPDDAAMIDRVMPALIQDVEGISGSNPLNFQYPAINALAGCGPLAKAAVPALVKCLKASDGYIRQATADALKKIDPQAAAEAGVK